MTTTTKNINNKDLDQVPTCTGPAHHWVLAEPNGTHSTGTCKHCNATILAINAMPYDRQILRRWLARDAKPFATKWFNR